MGHFNRFESPDNIVSFNLREDITPLVQLTAIPLKNVITIPKMFVVNDMYNYLSACVDNEKTIIIGML